MALKLMASFNGQNKNFCKGGRINLSTQVHLLVAQIVYLQAHLKTIGVRCFICMMYFLLFCFILFYFFGYNFMHNSLRPISIFSCILKVS